MAEDYIQIYATNLAQKIGRFQEQWRGKRFATVQQTNILDDDQQDNQQNQQGQQLLQKYRGKNGDIKPLGMILYKKYIHNFQMLFSILFIFMSPVMLIYSFNSGLKQLTLSQFSKFILTVSIANLPGYRFDDLSNNDILQVNFMRFLTVTFDILAILIMFGFLVKLKFQIHKITLQYSAKSPMSYLYCLQVQNIQGCSIQTLQQHFSKFASVSQISPVYTYKNIIYDLRKIVKLVVHLRYLKYDQQFYWKIMERVQTIYHQLAQTYFSIPKPTIKSVFLIFDQIKQRNRVFQLYKYGINKKKLYITKNNQNYNNNNNNKSQLQFNLQNGQKILQSNTKADQFSVQILLNQNKNKIMPKISKCNIQPLTINWQNTDIDHKRQLIKTTFQVMLLMIMVFVILLGLFLLHISSSQMKQQFSSRISMPNQASQFQLRQKYTFCSSLSLSEQWQYFSTCQQYFQIQRNRFVLMLMFALMVSVINLLTNRILWALVNFRRYRTLAQRNKFLITSIFLFSTINSAVLILLIRDNYFGPKLRDFIAYIIGFQPQLMSIKVFQTYNRNWYGSIGTQLAMNYIVSLLTFPFFHIVLHWLRFKYRMWKQKRTEKIGRKPVLNYCTFYAMSLKAIFFALMYCNSMPIFYLFALIAISIQIFIVNFLLKNFVDQPVFVDNQAIHVATNLFPYAMILHCVTSFLFLDVQQIFPSWQSYQRIKNNFKQSLLIKSRIQKKFGAWLLNKKKDQNQTSNRANYQKKFSQLQSNKAFLSSYKMKDNPKYKVLQYALQLFTHHMQSIRQKGGIKNLSNIDAFNNMFKQQPSAVLGNVNNSIQKNRNLIKNPSLQHLKQKNNVFPTNQQQVDTVRNKQNKQTQQIKQNTQFKSFYDQNWDLGQINKQSVSVGQPQNDQNNQDVFQDIN